MKHITLTIFALVVMAFVAQADELTICDGNAECQYSPCYGLKMYYGSNICCQSIYPAEKLIDMKDKWITAVKFYSVDAFGFFDGAGLYFALMEVEQDHFESATMLTGATVVTWNDLLQGDTEIVFYLNEPFKYNGSNLLIQTLPKWEYVAASSKFKGEATNQVTSMARYKQSEWSSEYLYESEANLPKVTFTFGNDSTFEPIERCTRPECWWSLNERQGEAFVTITNNEEGATVYYRVYRDNFLIKKGSFTGDTYSFSVLGFAEYSIVAIAKKEGMYDSHNGGVWFNLFDMYNIGPDPMRGDVNLSSSVNMDDLTALINYLVTEDATRISLTNADCEQDGKVNMDDLTNLINYLVFGQWPD